MAKRSGRDKRRVTATTAEIVVVVLDTPARSGRAGQAEPSERPERAGCSKKRARALNQAHVELINAYAERANPLGEREIARIRAAQTAYDRAFKRCTGHTA